MKHVLSILREISIIIIIVLIIRTIINKNSKKYRFRRLLRKSTITSLRIIINLTKNITKALTLNIYRIKYLIRNSFIILIKIKLRKRKKRILKTRK